MSRINPVSDFNGMNTVSLKYFLACEFLVLFVLCSLCYVLCNGLEVSLQVEYLHSLSSNVSTRCCEIAVGRGPSVGQERPNVVKFM